MAGLRWDLRPSRLFEWLGDIRRRQVEAATLRVAERMSREIEAWMRQNAPWTDRTGQARRLLQAEVIDVTGRAALIVLQHGTDYGSLYLETMQGGRFAIIGPALDYWSPRIMRAVQIELAGGAWGVD
jgi:hypothetical protein